MFVSLMLLVLATGGPDSPQGAGPNRPSIPQFPPAILAQTSTVGFQVKLYQFDGLGWRGEAHELLTPVTEQGGAKVWTAPASALAKIEETADRAVPTPDSLSMTGLIAKGRSISYVADLARAADGPVGAAHVLAFNPVIRQVEERFRASLEGRRYDQGMLTDVKIEDVRLRAMRTYEIRETLAPEGDRPGRPLAARVQVPEMVTGRVEGSWMIPNDGLLIVSLGVSPGAEPGQLVDRVVVIRASDPTSPTIGPDTAAWVEPRVPPSMTGAASSWVPAGRGEMATTTSRLRRISAMSKPIAPPVVMPKPTAPIQARFPVDAPTMPHQFRADSSMTDSDGDAAPAPPEAPDPSRVAMAIPQPPSQSLPTPIDAEGHVVGLPPIPAEEPLFVENSDEPRPSPQTVAGSRALDRAIEAPKVVTVDLAAKSPKGKEAPKRLRIELHFSVKHVPATSSSTESATELAKSVRAAFDAAARKASMKSEADESRDDAEPAPACCPCCSECATPDAPASKSAWEAMIDRLEQIEEIHDLGIFRPAASNRDREVAKVKYEPPKRGERRLSFGLSSMPVTPMASTAPFQIRLPIGRFGMIQIQSTKDRLTYPMGAFW